MLTALLTTLVEKVPKDPSGHWRFAALEAWCCSTLYLLLNVFLLVPLCTWKFRSTCPSVTSLCFFDYSLSDILSPKMAFSFSLSVHTVPLSFTGYFRALKVMQVLCVNIHVAVFECCTSPWYGLLGFSSCQQGGNFTGGEMGKCYLGR